MKNPKPLRFVFISSNHSAWGGSEELWGASAAVLAERGHQVTVYKAVLEPDEPRVMRLRALGCKLNDLTRIFGLPRKVYSAFSRLTYPLTHAVETIKLSLALKLSRRPDLVIISQGGNVDGWLQGGVCQRLGLPYVLVMQKATDLYWPPDTHRNLLRRIYGSARWCFFVSEHNRRLTEQQLALDLPHASVVRNPFLVPAEATVDWPEDSDGMRLACVGRLFPKEKGQDLLLRVLARAKWRARPLSVTFYGSGIQDRGLKEMAAYLKLDQVTFGGFVRDVESIWRQHHGLVLPSRCEGLPLVAVEAMMRGRVPILTDVGGARELVDDNLTGFVAAAPTEDSLDEALERAWQRRDEWRSMGAAAAQRVRTLVPADPAKTFADLLEQRATRQEPTADLPVFSPAPSEPQHLGIAQRSLRSES
jgi:glycosyltransferase involved in cell wall biosynthesis